MASLKESFLAIYWWVFGCSSPDLRWQDGYIFDCQVCYFDFLLGGHVLPVKSTTRGSIFRCYCCWYCRASRRSTDMHVVQNFSPKALQLGRMTRTGYFSWGLTSFAIVVGVIGAGRTSCPHLFSVWWRFWPRVGVLTCFEVLMLGASPFVLVVVIMGDDF
jgi:hypothetical protein